HRYPSLTVPPVCRLPWPPPLLFEHDENFHSWIDNVARCMYRNLTRQHDRVPQRSSLVQTEVLILQFHRDRSRRYRRMAECYSREKVLYQALNVVRSGDFNELRNFTNEVVDPHPCTDGQKEVGVPKILIFRHCAGPEEAVARRERYSDKFGWDDGF